MRSEVNFRRSPFVTFETLKAEMEADPDQSGDISCKIFDASERLVAFAGMVDSPERDVLRTTLIREKKDKIEALRLFNLCGGNKYVLLRPKRV